VKATIDTKHSSGDKDTLAMQKATC